MRTIEAPSDHRSCALQSNDCVAEGPVDLGRDENFYGHPGEGAGATDETAGHRDGLPDIARDRDRDQIEAAEAAISRVECDPAGSRYEDLRPRMGRSCTARSDAPLFRIVKIAGDESGSEPEHACCFGE